MARIKLSTRKFQSTVKGIIAEIDKVIKDEYKVTFNEGTAYVTQRDTFFFNFMDMFMALTALYETSMWVSVRDGKPTLVIVNR